MKLFVDDERQAPDKTWMIVRSFEMATFIIKVFSHKLSEISLDHDLNDTVNGKDGAGIAKLLLEMALDGKLKKDIIITCHSENCVGAKNIVGYVKDIYRVLEK